ncbi:hypothetical protein ACOME3_009627 [Neoechinorhynchus agilis]
MGFFFDWRLNTVEFTDVGEQGWPIRHCWSGLVVDTMSNEKLPWGLDSSSLAPGSLRTITDAKIRAFEHGDMNKTTKTMMTKKEQEELKRKQEQEATAEVYRDFVASFQDSGSVKSFVKGDTIAQLNPEGSMQVKRGSLHHFEGERPAAAYQGSRQDDCGSKRQKSNLEVFKEELNRDDFCAMFIIF